VGPAELPDDVRSAWCVSRNGRHPGEVVMALRVQERLPSSTTFRIRRAASGATGHRGTAQLARRNAIVMHPGPMNRGVEIDRLTARSR
jgi:aspartate carbamoyltransferase catalytic subunit